LEAQAQDSDGTVAQIEFFAGAMRIATLVTPPYSYEWSDVLQGTYAITARATDDLGGVAISNAVTITVGTSAKRAYYIDTDHLNTPRVVTDQNQSIVWRWDQQEPFGVSVPDEDPTNSGNLFSLNLRFPGQYFDRETGLHYNYFRDFDPNIGRYVQGDPIGLKGGLNLYQYALSNPITFWDSLGLEPPKLTDQPYVDLRDPRVPRGFGGSEVPGHPHLVEPPYIDPDEGPIGYRHIAREKPEGPQGQPPNNAQPEPSHILKRIISACMRAGARVPLLLCPACPYVLPDPNAEGSPDI